MAFDGAFLHTLLPEINAAAGARVEKIYEPSRDELLIHLKSRDFSGKLLISARNGSARIGFTEAGFENPAVPPAFCMYARKIFSSARFVKAGQPGLERVIELYFEASNELGDLVRPKIVCEFIGGNCNIIMCDENGRIFDAVNRSDITAKRVIMPGCLYEYPESRGKLDITAVTPEEIVNAMRQKNGEAASVLLGVCDGVSPLVCREAVLSAFGSSDALTEDVDLSLLVPVLVALKGGILGNPSYTALYDNGVPKDFSFTDINQYGSAYEKKHYTSGSEMLDDFYTERDRAARLRKQSGDLLKTVNNLSNRVRRRMNLRIKDLEATRDREKLRIYGELIKANIHAIKTGDRKAVVRNFYDEDLGEIEIPLDVSLSPAANAAKYFKEYKKRCAASISLVSLIESDKRESEYLDSVLYSLEEAVSVSDISDIREELTEAGYLKSKNAKGRKRTAPSAEEHLSREGYKILVGHNNIQNDYITTRLADRDDTWLHAKNIHGSHVIIKNGGGEISEETLLFAAKLAAKNSRAKNSSNVPVDYTPVRYVKKPAGSKAGMVIYTKNRTIYVTPREE